MADMPAATRMPANKVDSTSGLPWTKPFRFTRNGGMVLTPLFVYANLPLSYKPTSRGGLKRHATHQEICAVYARIFLPGTCYTARVGRQQGRRRRNHPQRHHSPPSHARQQGYSA